MAGLGSSLVGLRLPQSMASLGGAPVQGGGVTPPPQNILAVDGQPLLVDGFPLLFA